MTEVEAAAGAATERRIAWLTLLFGFIAATILALVHQRPWAAGLAIGTVLAWLNFRWLKRGLDALVRASEAQQGREKPRVPLATYFTAIFATGCSPWRSMLFLIIYTFPSAAWL